MTNQYASTQYRVLVFVQFLYIHHIYFRLLLVLSCPGFGDISPPINKFLSIRNVLVLFEVCDLLVLVLLLKGIDFG